MNLLVLYQAENPMIDHPGYFCGFERMKQEKIIAKHVGVGYLKIVRESGWDNMWKVAYDLAREIDAEAILLQYFQSEMPDPSEAVARFSNLRSRPTVFCNLGDGYGHFTHAVPQGFRAISRKSEISFLTGMGYVANTLKKSGSKNIVLLPNGCCQERFATACTDSCRKIEYDACFIGNNVISKNWFSYTYKSGMRRQSFVKTMQKRYGQRFALYGSGWQGYKSWQGPIPYGQQHDVYRQSAVIMGGLSRCPYDYYTSDRTFVAAASGVPLIEHRVPGIDVLFRDGQDLWLADDNDQFVRRCDELLELPLERSREVAALTRQLILQEHTQYHRCKQMIDIVAGIRSARQEGRVASDPQLPFLKYQAGSNLPAAVVNWVG